MPTDTTKTHDLTFDEYRAAVNARFLKRYGVTLQDLGFDLPGFGFPFDDLPPDEYVDWFATKYDLLDLEGII